MRWRILLYVEYDGDLDKECDDGLDEVVGKTTVTMIMMKKEGVHITPLLINVPTFLGQTYMHMS